MTPIALAIGLAAYLLGSVPFARLVAARYGVDLAATGSGVASIANVRHTLGRGPMLAAAVGDVGKVLVSVFAVSRVSLDWGAWVAVWVVVGHNWPVFARFNGGRGILAAITASVVLIPA